MLSTVSWGTHQRRVWEALGKEADGRQQEGEQLGSDDPQGPPRGEEEILAGFSDSSSKVPVFLAELCVISVLIVQGQPGTWGSVLDSGTLFWR